MPTSDVITLCRAWLIHFKPDGNTSESHFISFLFFLFATFYRFPQKLETLCILYCHQCTFPYMMRFVLCLWPITRERHPSGAVGNYWSIQGAVAHRHPDTCMVGNWTSDFLLPSQLTWQSSTTAPQPSYWMEAKNGHILLIILIWFP